MGAEPLLPRVRAARAAAEAAGALIPLRSRLHHAEDAEATFQVRVIEARVDKPRHTGASRDPFEPPYDPALFLGDLSPTHALLLNKYPVLDEHVLVVTRAWAPQSEPPDAADLEATHRVLQQLGGLAFYNGGAEAGASQPHRHTQVVSAASLGPVPLEPSLGAWPLRHAWAPLDPSDLHGTFLRLYDQLDRPRAFNLLWTPTRMWVVPRARSHVDGIEVNSLGFAGSLVVRDEAGLAELRRRGPWTVLAAATEGA